jgi:hypothetical protein
LQFHYVSDIQDVLAAALLQEKVERAMDIQ